MSDSNDSRAKQEVVGQLQAMQSTQEQPIGADRSIDLAIEQGDVVAAAPTGNRRWRPWLILLVVLIVAVAVVCVSLFVVLKPSGTKQIDPLAAATRFSSPQETVDEATPYLKGEVMEVASSSGIAALDSQGYGIYSPPTYRVARAKFNVQPLESTGAGYTSDSTTAALNYKSFVHFFEVNKFKKVLSTQNQTGSVSSGDYGTYINYAVYESNSMLCAIRHTDASNTDVNAHISSIGCASKASYEEATKVLQPFYVAYTDEDAKLKDDLEFGLLSRGEGLDGYQRAIIYQRDESRFQDGDSSDISFKALYLKKPQSDEWFYFNDIQGDIAGLYCSLYNDNILKKSFDGLPCYDEKSQKESTVQ